MIHMKVKCQCKRLIMTASKLISDASKQTLIESATWAVKTIPPLSVSQAQGDKSRTTESQKDIFVHGLQITRVKENKRELILNYYVYQHPTNKHNQRCGGKERKCFVI